MGLGLQGLLLLRALACAQSPALGCIRMEGKSGLWEERLNEATLSAQVTKVDCPCPHWSAWLPTQT